MQIIDQHKYSNYSFRFVRLFLQICCNQSIKLIFTASTVCGFLRDLPDCHADWYEHFGKALYKLGQPWPAVMHQTDSKFWDQTEAKWVKLMPSNSKC